MRKQAGASTQGERVACYFAAATGYARLYEGSRPCAQFLNERLRRVLQAVGALKGGKVLEVGCGPGVLLHRLASSKCKLYGLDCSSQMIAEAKRRTAGTNAKFTVGRAEQLPFEDQSFDVVLALGVLEYLPEVTTGLNEIARVAKPNAVIIVSMLNAVSLNGLWKHLHFSSLLRTRKRKRSLPCGCIVGNR